MGDVDTFVSAITVSIRRSLYARLRQHGLSQDELTGIVAGATKAAVMRAQVRDLATVATATGPVVAALTAAAPADPALAAFATATDGLSSPVSDLLAV